MVITGKNEPPEPTLMELRPPDVGPMLKRSILGLTLCAAFGLAGCEPPKQQTLAQCKLRMMELKSPSDEYLVLCMEAAGYAYRPVLLKTEKGDDDSCVNPFFYNPSIHKWPMALSSSRLDVSCTGNSVNYQSQWTAWLTPETPAKSKTERIRAWQLRHPSEACVAGSLPSDKEYPLPLNCP